MKFVFIGYDYSLDIAQALIEDGHELLRVYTFPCDNVFSFNTQTKTFAQHYQVPFTDKKIMPSDINECINDGCTLFLCAGYTHKIPPIDEKKAYGINIHPAVLPKARGIMPLPYIIMKEPEAAGFTAHKLAPYFDTGDIVYKENVKIDDQTDVETLSARIGLRARIAMPEIIRTLEEKWKNATAQNEADASTYFTPDEEMRTLNWNNTVEKLLLLGRAFGRYGTIAHIENDHDQKQTLGVFQFSAWKEEHAIKPGTLLRSSPREIIISISDGFICLKDFKVI